VRRVRVALPAAREGRLRGARPSEPRVRGGVEIPPFQKLFQRLKSFYAEPASWPELEDEVGEYREYLRGRVLNAGAGDRDLSPLIQGELVNQDLPHGWHNENIHIHSPLHEIPVADGHFDTIFCNAVLEHVANPSEVMDEFHRVLRTGGHLYLCVPFMQPEHLDPGDYQRYTQDGLRKLATDHGFEVIKSSGVHSAYHTLAWIINDWLRSKKTPSYVVLRLVLNPLLKFKCRHSKTYVHTIASGYRVLARKR
jgi:SAM-dependent methyltransferase